MKNALFTGIAGEKYHCCIYAVLRCRYRFTTLSDVAKRKINTIDNTVSKESISVNRSLNQVCTEPLNSSPEGHVFNRQSQAGVKRIPIIATNMAIPREKTVARTPPSKNPGTSPPRATVRSVAAILPTIESGEHCCLAVLNNTMHNTIQKPKTYSPNPTKPIRKVFEPLYCAKSIKEMLRAGRAIEIA